MITFLATTEEEISDSIREHLNDLSGPIDSFLEDHIHEANHYVVKMNGTDAGYTSVYKESFIVQFALQGAARLRGEEIFSKARRLESVRGALVPTSDQFFLAHALDNFSKLTKQAIVFEPVSSVADLTRLEEYDLRLATMEDLPLINESTGDDFLEDPEPYIRSKEVYLTIRNEETVGFGIIERSRYQPERASLGMFTIESVRRTGVGTATMQLLKAKARELNIQPVAGCWYYNHGSKETLQKAGMIASGRYIRVEF